MSTLVFAYARIPKTIGETQLNNNEQRVRQTKRAHSRIILILWAAFAIAALQAQKLAPKDPGPRQDASGGAIMTGLTGVERELYRKGLEAFEIINSVQGDAFVPQSEIGLGPTFNMDSCAGCHAYPSTGGTSPLSNPQIAVAHKEGAQNRIPAFLRTQGPVLQVRFRLYADGTRDGSVHALYTIAGRRDAPGCQMAQPEFDKESARGNLSFRIPTPVYGAGLIEAISDATIIANKESEKITKRTLGIEGTPNRDSRDGGITRFGWKAQTRSLDVFAAEAYLIEQGVTSEIFPGERDNPPDSCLFNATPEDRKGLIGRRLVEAHSNVTRVAHFMRFLGAPVPMQETTSSARGRELFTANGCAFCHTPELKTGRSSHAALADKPVPLYSDLLLHYMGSGLADEVIQGDAGPGQFRTAPLWGLGQRIFLLHDGRTKDLVDAILLHADRSTKENKSKPLRSEANQVIARYRRLSSLEQQDLLHFLRSL
jgi:CxxC motif-containing protein (DUF1111 family)